jgi:hypothetical protein
MDIVQQFAQLPPWVYYRGCLFQLMLVVNGRADDVRLVYSLEDVMVESKDYAQWNEYGCWTNVFSDNKPQGFLWLCEGISNDDDLKEAIGDVLLFLYKNSLIDVPGKNV